MTKKLTITRKKAIAECKKLWEEIVASGLSKRDFLCTPERGSWVYKEYQYNCPLCEYSRNFTGNCCHCPLAEKYLNNCFTLGFDEEDITNYPQFLEAVRGL